MMTSQEKKGCLKLINSFFNYHIPKVSLTKFHQSYTTKSRIIHVRNSIPKQYKMMMSSVARVRFIKTMVIFRYHTKGISNQV